MNTIFIEMVDMTPPTASSIKQMIETTKYNVRECGASKMLTKLIILDKLHKYYHTTGHDKYKHAYNLLNRFLQHER